MVIVPRRSDGGDCNRPAASQASAGSGPLLAGPRRAGYSDGVRFPTSLASLPEVRAVALLGELGPVLALPVDWVAPAP